MGKHQIAEIADSFISDDLSSMENTYETVYHMVLEAIGTGTAKEVKEQFSDFYEKEEQLAEIMGVMDSSNPEMGQVSGQYWFGQIKALTDLLSEYVKQELEQQDFLELNKCSKHLDACLLIINEHPRISGMDLKQQLRLKDSNFSNFLKRIESYQLLNVIKSGNTKYYTLSPQGRRYLQKTTTLRSRKTSQTFYNEEFLVCLLRFLASELRSSERPSVANVILQMNLHGNKGSALIGNSRIVRHAIKQVFTASEQRQHQKMLAFFSSIGKDYPSDASTSYVTTYMLRQSQWIGMRGGLYGKKYRHNSSKTGPGSTTGRFESAGQQSTD